MTPLRHITYLANLYVALDRFCRAWIDLFRAVFGRPVSGPALYQLTKTKQ